jgi:6-phosphogluconolactonase/glucosamine-6-phosphate isomerase/deaminase
MDNKWKQMDFFSADEIFLTYDRGQETNHFLMH